MYLGIILVLFAILLIVVIEYWKGKINKTRVTICGIIFAIYTIFLGIFMFQNNNTTKTNKIETQKSIESPIKES